MDNVLASAGRRSCINQYSALINTLVGVTTHSANPVSILKSVKVMHDSRVASLNQCHSACGECLHRLSVSLPAEGPAYAVQLLLMRPSENWHVK